MNDPNSARELLLSLLLPFVLATASCQTQAQVAADTKARDDARQASDGVVLDMAATELRCPRANVTVAARLPSRWANTFELRYVIDGCSQRALYAESCDVHGDGCSALMVSRTQLEGSPGPAPGPATAPPAASSATLQDATGGDGPTPACAKADNQAAGAWAPSPDDVLAALSTMPGDVCGGPESWPHMPAGAREQTVRACMKQQGSVAVAVMFGVFDGTNQTPKACVLRLTTAESNGRRFVAATTGFRDGAFFAAPWTDVAEASGAAPVLFMDGADKYAPLCGIQKDANAATPPGWARFPAPLQAFLCNG